MPGTTLPCVPLSPPHGRQRRDGQTHVCLFGDMEGALGRCHLVSQTSWWGLGCLRWDRDRSCPEGPPQNPAGNGQRGGKSFPSCISRNHKTSLEMTSQNPNQPPPVTALLCCRGSNHSVSTFSKQFVLMSVVRGLHNMPVQDGKPCLSHTHPN